MENQALLCGRSINWLESTRRSLQASVPEAAESAPYVTERLSALLLQRLPAELAADILRLLPDNCAPPEIRRAPPGLQADASIGFTTFIETTRHLLGMSELLDSPRYSDSEELYAELCERVADAFLWAFLQEFPADLKHHIAPHLPSDLRCRMNLYSGYSGAEKVA